MRSSRSYPELTAVVVALLGAAVLTPLILFGEHAKQENRERRATQHQQMVALAAPAEMLHTRLGDAPAYKGEYVSGGKVSTTYRYWTFLETQDWVLLNGRYGSKTCPQLLDDFVSANVPYEVMTPERMDVLTVALRGKDVSIWAHVPRFKSRPPALDKCWGFGFDEERGMLTLGGKPVGVMAAKQPTLQEQAHGPSPR